MDKSSPEISRDFVSADLRGLKAALVARARAERLSVSALLRRAVAHELGLEDKHEDRPLEAVDVALAPSAVSPVPSSLMSWVRHSLRLTPAESDRLISGAQAAGLSRSAYVAGLMAGIPVLASGESRAGYLAALTASCAELSTLSRNTHRLTELLRVGDVQQALHYRDVLDRLGVAVRQHLRLAAQVLSDLHAPRGWAAASARRSTSQRPSRRSPWLKE